MSFPLKFEEPANAEWWRLKLQSVQHRDADTLEQLTDAGWLAVVVWEHEDMVEAARSIAALERARRGRRRRSTRSVP